MSDRRRNPAGGQPPGRAGQLLRRADGLQQRSPVLALAFATCKKFSDDQASYLAGLIAYFGFASIFPLLLVFISVLELLVRHDAGLRHRLLDSALSQYPGVSKELTNLPGLRATGFALVVGLFLALYGARRIVLAIQSAMNTAWGVPRYRRPKVPYSLLRGLGLLAVIGPGLIATVTLSGLAGGEIGHLGSIWSRCAVVGASLVLNFGLFWLGFRIATAKDVPTRDLRLSAILAAIAFEVLQLVGGYFITHQLETNSAYGAFGIVLGLLAWLYLQAQLTLFLVELSVVRARHLWPRTLVQPPFAHADMRAYEMSARASQSEAELRIEVRPEADAGSVARPDGSR
jgi:membrane protein